MRIKVLVKPNARHERVEKLSETEFRVSVHAPPSEGKANQAVIQVLARYLSIPPSSLTLVHGTKGKVKIFEWFQ